MLLPALIAGRRDDAIRERASELLDRVGLGHRTAHLPSELSGGEQQRVSIARALLTEPELVLADEPTGNLDSRSSAQILDLLRDLNDAEGQTLVIVTHDSGAAAIAERVVFLRDGRWPTRSRAATGRPWPRRSSRSGPRPPRPNPCARSPDSPCGACARVAPGRC